MLNIDDLKVSLEEEEKQIIKGLSLSIKPGEVHAIMGPNGSGKSTLSSVLAGKDGYIIDSGTCLLYTSPSPRDERLSRMPSSA